MGRRSFTTEFKHEAVKLVLERGMTVSQASRDLGLHLNVLRKWVADAKANEEAARVVYQALLDGKRLQMTYTPRTPDGEGDRDYEVNPLGLVARGNLIYLVCTLWDYDDIRQLALHRVKSAVLTGAKTVRPQNFDLDLYIEQGEFQYPVGPMIHFKAKFDRGAAAHLYETPLSTDQTIKEIDTAQVIVTATVRDSAQLTWWLRGFGDLVEVIHPNSLLR